MVAACRLIEAAEEPPSLEALAASAGMSRFYFHRVFTRIAGVTPKAYAAGLRAARARRLLPERATVTEAIYAAGFNSSGRFYADSRRFLGMAPKQFRAGGVDVVIHFAVRKCSLGFVLVAITSKGICAILLGDTRRELIADLQHRFPKATLARAENDFARWIAEVARFVEAPQSGLGLPLDIRGTAFQQRVWQALQKIPVGNTATYSDVASAIGSPKAVRAVAGACAANAIAVAIPCHRVVRQDGSLSGYRWGVKRKRTLLTREST